MSGEKGGLLNCRHHDHVLGIMLLITTRGRNVRLGDLHEVQEFFDFLLWAGFPRC